MDKKEANSLKLDSLIAKDTRTNAQYLSARYSLLVLHISGGVDKKYSAKDYSKMLQVMFKDYNRTNLPTEIYIRYKEESKDRPTLVSAFINGFRYDKNGKTYELADGVFTPIELLDHIRNITKEYDEKNKSYITHLNISLSTNENVKKVLDLMDIELNKATKFKKKVEQYHNAIKSKQIDNLKFYLQQDEELFYSKKLNSEEILGLAIIVKFFYIKKADACYEKVFALGSRIK